MTADTPLYRLLAAATELVWLTTLWLLACLPVVTAPAATTALFRLARTRSEARAGALEFVAAMRSGFRRSTVTGGGWLVAGAVLAGDLWAIAALPDAMRVGAGAVLISVLVVHLAATPYLFTALAEPDLPGARVVRLAVLAALGTPGTAVRCLVVLAAGATAVVVVWPLVFVVPAVCAMVLARLCHAPATAATTLVAR